MCWQKRYKIGVMLALPPILRVTAGRDVSARRGAAPSRPRVARQCRADGRRPAYRSVVHPTMSLSLGLSTARGQPRSANHRELRRAARGAQRLLPLVDSLHDEPHDLGPVAFWRDERLHGTQHSHFVELDRHQVRLVRVRVGVRRCRVCSAVPTPRRQPRAAHVAPDGSRHRRPVISACEGAWSARTSPKSQVVAVVVLDVALVMASSCTCRVVVRTCRPPQQISLNLRSPADSGAFGLVGLEALDGRPQWRVSVRLA